MRHLKCRSCVVDATKQVGFMRMRGTAPPGYMEEELQDWVEALVAD